MSIVDKGDIMVVVYVDEESVKFSNAAFWVVTEDRILQIYATTKLVATFSRWDYVRFYEVS